MTTIPDSSISSRALKPLAPADLAALDAGFHPRLESIRGLAALSVVFFHYSQFAFMKDLAPQKDAVDAVIEKVLVSIFNGSGAVNVFFVLSGFVLGASVRRSRESGLPLVVTFVIRRLFRLYPMIIASAALYAVLYWLFDTPRPVSEIFLNCSLLSISMNGPMWSLQVEMLAIPFILAAAMPTRRMLFWPALLLTVALFGMCFNGTWLRGYGFVMTLSPLWAFTAGVLLPRFLPVARDAGRPWVIVSLVAALGLLLIPTTVSHSFIWNNILQVFGATLLISTVAFRKDAPVAVLDHPFVRFFGSISYSLYLLHLAACVPLAWLAGLGESLPFRLNAAINGVILMILLVAVIIPASWLCWRFIELPLNGLGHQVSRRVLHARMRTAPAA